MGVIGALFFLGIFFVALACKVNPEANELSRMYFYAAKAAIIAIGISALFSYPMHTTPTIIVFFFALAILSALSSGFTWKLELKPSHLKMFAVLLLVFATILATTAYRRNKAERKWFTAFQLMRQVRIDEAYQVYNEIYDVMQYSQFFKFNYGAELNLMKRYDESIKVLRDAEPRINDADFYIYLGSDYENKGMLNEAELCFKKAGNIMPYKFFPKYRLVKIYQASNRIDDALTLAKQMINMPVKIQNQVTESILGEMRYFVEQQGKAAENK
jgi:hypothetical protein